MTEPETREFFLFTVPGKPMPWQRARTRGGQFFKPKETRAYQKLVRDCCALRMPATWLRDGSYELLLTFVLPDWHTRDWDNLGKQISDALNGLAYNDDNQVIDAIVQKRVGPVPMAIVTVTRVGDWAAKRKRVKKTV